MCCAGRTSPLLTTTTANPPSPLPVQVRAYLVGFKGLDPTHMSAALNRLQALLASSGRRWASEGAAADTRADQSKAVVGEGAGDVAVAREVGRLPEATGSYLEAP
jgi:hypothetical protein